MNPCLLEMKYCSGCGIEHSIKEFGKRKSSPDGYENQCRKYLGTRKKIRNQLKRKTGDVCSIELVKLLNNELIKEKLCTACGEYWQTEKLTGLDTNICKRCGKENPHLYEKECPSCFVEIDNEELDGLYLDVCSKKNLSNAVIRCVYDRVKDQYELRIFSRDNKEIEIFWYKNFNLSHVIEKAKEVIKEIDYNPDTWSEDDGFAMWQDYNLK